MIIVPQAPTSDLDYVMDWSAWLNQPNETISSVSWSVGTGLTLGVTFHDASTATAFIAATGSPGALIRVACTVVSSITPKTDTRVFYVKIAEL